MRIFCLAILLFAAIHAKAETPLPAVPLPYMKTEQVTVSGISSGAQMAVQFQVAFSRTVKGAGLIAAGPYFCARGDVLTATTICSCTNEVFPCQVRARATRVRELIAVTDWFSALQVIDPTSAMAGHRIWILAGSADTIVPQVIGDDLQTYYRHYIDPSRIAYKRDLAVQHAMPTDNYGNDCDALGLPFINNCSYDAAGELLKWMYGPLTARNTGTRAGRLVVFDQAEFLPWPRLHGMARKGYMYVPPGCDNGARNGCRLHVAFHGCLQDAEHIGTAFIDRAGYNAWADSNKLVILYPQAAAISKYKNPNACWDWFAYDDPRYPQKRGRQMAAIKRMVDRLTGAPVTRAAPPAPAAKCRRDKCT